MFYVPQKTNIKRIPNGIKTDGDFFRNIHEFWEEESTRADARGGHETGGHTPGGQARPGPSWPHRKAVGALLSPQES